MKKFLSVFLGLAILFSGVPTSQAITLNDYSIGSDNRAAVDQQHSELEQMGISATQEDDEYLFVYDYWGVEHKKPISTSQQEFSLNKKMAPKTKQLIESSTINSWQECREEFAASHDFNIIWQDWECEPPYIYTETVRNSNGAGNSYENQYDRLIANNAENLKNPQDILNLGYLGPQYGSVGFKTLIPVQISSSASFSLSLKENGTVWAWGADDFGQCGPLYNAEQGPVQIPKLANIKEIAAGWTFGMALDNEGNVWTWGSNLYGELGNGTTKTCSIPRKVDGLPPIKTISAPGMSQTCLAIGEDNSLWWWGKAGQMTSLLPVKFDAPTSDIANMAVKMKKIVYAYGDYFDHFVGIDDEGAIWEWNLQEISQLGSPTCASPTLQATDVVAGYDFAAVLAVDGTVWAKGKNQCGVLGNGTYSENSDYAPVQFSYSPTNDIFPIVKISAACCNLYMLSENGSMYCTGNASNRMNAGGTIPESLPVARKMSSLGTQGDTVMASGGMNYTIVASSRENSELGVGYNGRNYLGLPSGVKERINPTTVGSSPVTTVTAVNSPLIVVSDFSEIEDVLSTMPYVYGFIEDGEILKISVTWEMDNIEYSTYEGREIATVYGVWDHLRYGPFTDTVIYTFTVAPLSIDSVKRPTPFFVPYNISKDDLIEALPATVHAKNNSGTYMEVPVEWNMDEIDAFDNQHTEGKQTLHAALVLNEGLTNPKSLTTYTMIYVKPQIETVYSVLQPLVRIVPSGMSTAQLLQNGYLPKTVEVMVDYGEIKKVEVNWNMSSFDANRVGVVQTLVGEIVTPNSINNRDNLEVEIQIVVIAESTQTPISSVKELTGVKAPFNTTTEDLLKWYLPKQLLVYCGETAKVLQVVWDTSTYDPLLGGEEQILMGTLVLRDSITNPFEHKAVIKVTLENNPNRVITAVEKFPWTKVAEHTTFDELGLPETAKVTLANGAPKYLPIIWDASTYDPLLVGEEQILTGALVLSDGVSNPSEYKASIKIFIESDSAKAIASIEELEEITVIEGTPATELGLPKEVTVTLNNGTALPLSVKWDTTPYDPKLVGKQALLGELVLTEGVTNPSECKASITIVVEKPDTYTVVKFENPEDITVSYGTPAEQLELPDNVTVIYEKNNNGTITIEQTRVAVTWSASSYRPTEFGVYVLSGNANLPKEWKNPSEAQPQIQVEVAPIVKWEVGAENISDVAAYLYEDPAQPGELILKLSGEGDMKDFGTANQKAWQTYEKEITQVIVEEGVQNIGKFAFSNCSQIAQVDLGSVTYIAESAFSGCSALTDIEIPESVTQIATLAFRGCNALASITFAHGSNAEVDVKAQAFLCTSGKKQTAVIGSLDIVSDVGYWTDNNRILYTAVTSVDLSQSTASLSINETLALTAAVSPYNATNTAVTWTSSKDTVATVSAAGLVKAVGAGECVITVTTQDGEKTATCTVTVNQSWSVGEDITASLYPDAENEGMYILELVGSGAMTDFASAGKPAWFSQAAAISKIIVGEGITGIGDYSFCRMTNLTEVSLPEGLATIGVNSFNSCSALKEIVIPSTVTTIGSSAFYGCRAITSIVFRDQDGRLQLPEAGGVFPGSNTNTTITICCYNESVWNYPWKAVDKRNVTIVQVEP